MKKVTGKDKSQDFTDDDLRALMRDIERRENEIDAEFWDNAPDEAQEPEQVITPEATDNSDSVNNQEVNHE